MSATPVHLLIETGRAGRLAACDEPHANAQPGTERLAETTCSACRRMFSHRLASAQPLDYGALCMAPMFSGSPCNGITFFAIDDEPLCAKHRAPAPRTWADGFGVWHVRITALAEDPIGTAVEFLRDELEPREANCDPGVWEQPVRVPEQDTPGTRVYREGEPYA